MPSSQFLQTGTIHCHPVSMTCDAGASWRTDTKAFYICCGFSCSQGSGCLLCVNTGNDAPVRAGVLWRWWRRWRIENERKWYLHRQTPVTGLTCSCDPSGFPAARRQLWPGPAGRRRGSRWAACPTGWPRRPARRTRSPSTSSERASPGGRVRTDSRPAGSLSPGSRWLQTSWQRTWAALFAVKGIGKGYDKGEGEKKTLGYGGVPGWQGNKWDVCVCVKERRTRVSKCDCY